jgi:hypothetical protein
LIINRMPAACTNIPKAIIHFLPDRSDSAPVTSWAPPQTAGYRGSNPHAIRRNASVLRVKPRLHRGGPRRIGLRQEHLGGHFAPHDHVGVLAAARGGSEKRVQEVTGARIGRVAQETCLSIDTIRFYEKQGLLRRSPRTEGGFRLSHAPGKRTYATQRGSVTAPVAGSLRRPACTASISTFVFGNVDFSVY